MRDKAAGDVASDDEGPQLPQNISIHVEGSSPRGFFDRHFGAVLGAAGILGAAVLTGIYKENEAVTEPVPEFEIATQKPATGRPVRFMINELSDYSYTLRVAAVAGDGEAEEAQRDADGVFYTWIPQQDGAYVAELTVRDSNGGGSEKTRKLLVRSPTDAAHPVARSIDAPSLLSQTFTHRIGDNSSCSEKNATRAFDLCLRRQYSVVDWSGTYQSVRNGTASVERHPSQSSCVVLTLQYSDSGRGIFGDCKGNGWVDYAVTLNGQRKGSAE